MSTEPMPADAGLDAETARRLFNGDRLQVARELRERSQSWVGEEAGVSAAAISQFENGDARPSAETLAGIARALDLPVGFFAISPDDRDPNLPAFFRSLRSTPAADRKRARALTLLVRWLALELEHELRLPSLDVPRIPVDESAEQSEVEDVAAAVRRAWDHPRGPIENAVRLVELHGVIATRFSVGSDKLDAFSVPFPDRPVVVLGADKGDRARSRFDVLHELGHLVMHDPAERADKTTEQQAHWFAAAFLMPAADIVEDLPAKFDVRHFVSLKGEWGASIAALLRRSTDLGVMDQRTYVNAMKVLSARGWRKKEPGDLGPPEAPSLLHRALEVLSDKGISLADVAARANLPEDDIRYVLGQSVDPRPPVSL